MMILDKKQLDKVAEAIEVSFEDYDTEAVTVFVKQLALATSPRLKAQVMQQFIDKAEKYLADTDADQSNYRYLTVKGEASCQ